MINLWSDYSITGSLQLTNGLCSVTQDHIVMNSLQCKSNETVLAMGQEGTMLGQKVCVVIGEITSPQARYSESLY